MVSVFGIVILVWGLGLNTLHLRTCTLRGGRYLGLKRDFFIHTVPAHIIDVLYWNFDPLGYL